MIGETAFERKHGGRRLGLIIGQRTTADAQGRPVKQWEIRSSRGIKFFMAKAEVRIAAEPEPEPEPPSVVKAPPPPAKLDERHLPPIEQKLLEHRSIVPIVVTLVGIAVGLAGIALLVLVPTSVTMAVPLLAGLLIVFIGTNLIACQARRLDALRKKLLAEARDHTPENTP